MSLILCISCRARLDAGPHTLGCVITLRGLTDDQLTRFIRAVKDA